VLVVKLFMIIAIEPVRCGQGVRLLHLNLEAAKKAVAGMKN
jgi:hypothetical protein